MICVVLWPGQPRLDYQLLVRKGACSSLNCQSFLVLSLIPGRETPRPEIRLRAGMSLRSPLSFQGETGGRKCMLEIELWTAWKHIFFSEIIIK